MDELAKILIGFRKELKEEEEIVKKKEKELEKNIKSISLNRKVYELYGKNNAVRLIIPYIEDWFCRVNRMEYMKYKENIDN